MKPKTQMKSRFEDWFTAQYGKPPTKLTYDQLKKKVSNARYLLALAEFDLKQYNEYMDAYNLCLKGWNASAKWSIDDGKGSTK